MMSKKHSRRRFLKSSLLAGAGMSMGDPSRAFAGQRGSQTNYDVVVVGGGAMGCTTAYFLREEGFKVALVDKGKVGQEASWASAGMIGPSSSSVRNPWVLQATTLSKALYDELNERLHQETGRRIGYGGEGSLTLAFEEEEAERAKAAVEAQTADGVPAHLLTGAEAREREPALPEGVMAAVWRPEGRFLDARNYTATVAFAAGLKGVTFREGWPVTGMVWKGDRVIGVRSGSEVIHASQVINAAGAWAGGIDPKLAHPVHPDHGQIMAVEGHAVGLRHNVSRWGSPGYLTPRADGRVVVGATHDSNKWGYRKKITSRGLKYLGTVVRQILPVLGEQRVLDIWSGLRPSVQDGLSTVGPDPRVEGGYLWMTGHSSSGMSQAPATAKVVVDMAMGRKPRIPVEQLRIERYLKKDKESSKTAQNFFLPSECEG